MKVCIECKCNKPLGEFRWKNKSKGWRKSECKECSKKRDKKYYTPHRKHLLKCAKKKRVTLKQEWHNDLKKTMGCNRCGDLRWYLLEFHHSDPTTKEYAISDMFRMDFSTQRMLKEMNKCELLCANCHREHHHFDRLNKKEKLKC